MTKSEQIWAVVPAAGVGSRMQADIPKQYLTIEGKAVLAHTLHRLASHPRVTGIVVALAEHDRWWPQLDLNLDCELLITDGGEQRADSVFNALQLLSQHTNADPWVLVHDAARPCLRHEDIDHMIDSLLCHQVGGILGIPVNDTVKRVDTDNTIIETVSRTGLWRAATPQMFRLGLLTKSLQHATEQGFSVTDEASALELAGWQPKMVEGHSDNIKITVPKDLALAELFMQQQRGESQ